ncbi:hypothetical protein Tco_1196514, partial [Tanacetum coccineum]
MSTSKTYQQSLADAGSENRPPMLEMGSYIPWAKDLEGDDLLLQGAEIEVMNMILLSIPNEIYNFVDACTSAKDIWKRVERLMRGTIQNKVDRETRFTNKFDQFVAEPGEALQTRVHPPDKHPSVVDYDDEYQQDDIHNNSEDPLVSA